MDTLTSVDIEEFMQTGGKIIEIYEGVFYREKFKVNVFERFNGKLFELKKY